MNSQGDLKLIDFGCASTECNDSLIVGTSLYGSINQNRGLSVNYRDDLESALYTVLRLMLKQLQIDVLPWQNQTEVIKIKQNVCSNTPQLLKFILERKMNLSEIQEKKLLISVNCMSKCFEVVKDRNDYQSLIQIISKSVRDIQAQEWTYRFMNQPKVIENPESENEGQQERVQVT